MLWHLYGTLVFHLFDDTEYKFHRHFLEWVIQLDEPQVRLEVVCAFGDLLVEAGDQGLDHVTLKAVL